MTLVIRAIEIDFVPARWKDGIDSDATRARDAWECAAGIT